MQFEETIQKAREAQKIWAAVNVGERSRWLKNFQKSIFRQKEKIVTAILADTHKPVAEAIGIEIATVLMTADYYRKKGPKFLKKRQADVHWMFKNKKVRVERLPYGVVGILGPSNLPFSLTIGDAIPALLAGNAVVIKPSELTPKAAHVGAEIAFETGLPQNLIQIVEGGPDVGSQLIENVDCIFFTGSTTVGRKVAAKAGELLKPCILELGGKAPMIVLEDADIERAAQACVWGRFAHSGQHCIATERVYVDKKIAELFIKRVVKIVQTLTPESLSPSTLPKGPKHEEELLNDALQKGANIAYQKVAATFWSPLILTNVNHSMRVMKEESFGPLLPIMTFESIDEAIALANDSESGLSATLFTKNSREALSLAQRIEVGNVSINDVMDHFMIMDAPFSGWKQSGIGQRHAPEGLLQFTKQQTIFEHRFPLPFCAKKEFWWFPYRNGTLNLLKGLLRIFFG
ncbi:MAG: aldehyde dehydrogenase family protein [Deltaproteobacteria bacterium]|nr:aldehyde dehydrogenase family protein [Deltaproteobacteria bacterium]